MPLSHFLFDSLFSTFSCCFYFLKNKVPKCSLMVRNSREILFLLFSLYFWPSQAHIPTPYFEGCRGRRGTHFIPSSLVIHLKRCLLIKQFKHLNQELSHLYSPCLSEFSVGFILHAASLVSVMTCFFSLALDPELMCYLLPLSCVCLFWGHLHLCFELLFYISMAKCHTFHLFPGHNFLVNVHLPFAVPIVSV